MGKTREGVRQSLLATAGGGDKAVSERLEEIDPELEAYRQALRDRLIGSRGRTYTYTRPEELENRITIRMRPSSSLRPGLNRNPPTIGGVPAHGLGSDNNIRPGSGGPPRPGMFGKAQRLGSNIFTTELDEQTTQDDVEDQGLIRRLLGRFMK